MTKKENLMRKANAAVEAFKSQRLRWIIGRSQIGIEIDEKRYRQVADSIMQDEIERHMMIGAIRERGPLTVEELSQLTGIQPGRVIQHIIALRRNGMISEAGEKNRQYLYGLV